MSFDFDQIIDRSQSHSQKYDALEKLFGRSALTPMWVADMDFAAPPAVTEVLVARAEHPIYGYSQYPEDFLAILQHWFAQRHHWSFSKEAILMCPGVVPSIHATIMALSQPGDQVIVQSPVYFPFFSAVTDTGRSLVLNPLLETPTGYQINFAQLEQQAAAGAKLLVFCSPHNPVGRVWTQPELETLLDIAQRHQLTIISDEIHADLIFPGYQHVPLASLAKGVNVITTVSASKTFNIAGLGLSALIVNETETMQKINTVLNSWHVSADNPFSITATMAAYQYGADWLDALMQYLQANRDWLVSFFQQSLPTISISEAQGTYLLWLDCRQLGLSDKQLRQFFVEDCAVALNPGSMFGEGGSGFMRMNIAAPKSVLERACQQILTAYQKMSIHR